MAKKKKKTFVESVPSTPVKGLIYSDGVVHIPVSMITTKESFERIYSKVFRSAKALDDAWNKAEKFKEKNS